MSEFEDFVQLSDTLESVANITKQFNFRFVDVDNSTIFAETGLLDIVHGASQFGEYPNLDKQFNNEADTYYCKINSIVYVYFYNDDTSNDLTINGGFITESFAQDYNDDIFTDFDDENFTILTL